MIKFGINFWDSELGKKIFTFDEKHIYRKVYRIEN